MIHTIVKLPHALGVELRDEEGLPLHIVTRFHVQVDRADKRQNPGRRNFFS